VKRLVIPWFFRKSMSRVSIALTSGGFPDAHHVRDRIQATTRGLKLMDQLVEEARCISNP